MCLYSYHLKKLKNLTHIASLSYLDAYGFNHFWESWGETLLCLLAAYGLGGDMRPGNRLVYWRGVGLTEDEGLD
jgi:hypothetical protein